MAGKLRYSPPTTMFVVCFNRLDDLSFGPFSSEDDAITWAAKSVYVVQQRHTYEVRGVLRPRPDHTA